ncbi:MAG: DUF805 domain-containing protein [Ilumatobacteraceae bacterium]
MPIIDYWKLVVLERYAKFDGRARRAEFWWFVLANLIVYVVLAILAGAVSAVFWVLYVVYALAMLVPSIAVAIRRLHDTGKSGWFLLISFIPVVGPIILLVFYVLDSTPGTNQYGTSEKYPTG